MVIFAVAITLLVVACASGRTFADIQPSELNASTLWPGMELRVKYADGSRASITVREVTESSIIAIDGTAWPKTGIDSITVPSTAGAQDCGSLASWRSGPCWSDELEREVNDALRL
jgi:hypothetical protein